MASQLQDAVTKLYRFVVEIKMKAEFDDGRGPRNGVEGAIAPPILGPWSDLASRKNFMVIR